MIKVEKLYKITMFETSWIMARGEYLEFLEEVRNLPMPEDVTYVKEEITYEGEGEECPEYIEPPEVIIGADYGSVLTPKPHIYRVDIAPPFTHTHLKPFAHTSTCPPRATAEEIEKAYKLNQDTATVPKKNKKPAAIPDEYEEKFKAPTINPFNKNKKPGREGRNYDAYVEIMIEGASRDDVTDALMVEFDILKANAEGVYYRLLKRVASETAKVKITTMKPENQSPVTIVEPGKVKLPRALRDEISGMPNYKDAIALKDVFIRRSDCNAFDFVTLKEYYKASHPTVTW